jgi:hypothetical protein
VLLATKRVSTQRCTDISTSATAPATHSTGPQLD